MKCILPADVNTCPFYNKENAECNNRNDNNACSFQDNKTSIVNTKSKYVRKERWYEQYYKK